MTFPNPATHTDVTIMKQRVLIVDDKPANLFALRSLLRKIDVDIIEAQNGNEALLATLHHDFALALLDVQMPGMDGYELAELLRSNQKTENTPIIFLSAAFSDDFHIFKGYEAGAVDFIRKPYNPDILLSKILIFLELDRHRRHLEGVIEERTGELKEANRILTESMVRVKDAERKYRRLAIVVEQSSDAIIVTKTDGIVEYVNSAFTRVTGYEARDVIGNKPSILDCPQATEITFDDLWSQVSKGRSWTGKLVQKRKDNSLFEADVNICSVLGEDDTITNFVITQRDVTREAELSKQLRQAQKMEAVGQLAGGVAHDFNNLLTIILGQTQLLQLKLGQDSAICKNLESIQKAAQRAASLTRQLLAFSRKQVVKTTVFDMNVLIEDLLKMLKRLIGEDIQLKTVLNADKPRLKADPGQVEQCLLNLVVNGRDAIVRGGTITITTERRILKTNSYNGSFQGKPGEYVILRVTDTGCGMDSETIGRIFEPFFTTKEVGKGTGLGLAMVYGIVKQFDGHIDVSSEIGKGTTFELCFPHCYEDESDSRVEQTVLTAGSDETILLVEDEDDLRMLTR